MDEPLYRVVAERIRARREALGYSQTGLAESLRISRASLVNIEHQKQRPPLHVLWEIAEELKMEPRELIPLRSELDVPDLPAALTADLKRATPGRPDAVRERVARFIQDTRTTTNEG